MPPAWSAATHQGKIAVVGAEKTKGIEMIFITAKFRIKPEEADDWPAIAAPFTQATRAEAGCLWFDWSRSLDDPAEYVLVEAFRDDDAGAAHVNSEHFKAAQRELPPHLAETPRIVNFSVPQDDWSELGEMAV
jgi:quinol monooxygenase YgiN